MLILFQSDLHWRPSMPVVSATSGVQFKEDLVIELAFSLCC